MCRNVAQRFLDVIKVLSLTCVIAGQVALIGSTESGKGDVMVLIAVLGGIIGYIAKIYFTYVLFASKTSAFLKIKNRQ